MPQITKSNESEAQRATAKIFLFDRRIRYCALVDHKGGVLAGGMRLGTPQLVPPQETAKLHIQGMCTEACMRGGTNFLRVNIVAVQREKSFQIRFFLASGRNLVVSAEPDFPFRKVERLAKLVDRLNLEG